LDLAHALRTLQRRWKWALIGLLPAAFLALSTAYHVGPSGLHKNSLTYGAAQTQLLIDSPESTLSSATADVAPLSTRADVFAQFFQTAPVKAEISQLLHIRGAVAVSIPNLGLSNSQIIPTAGTTNAGLLQAGRSLQLEVIAQQGLPLISLYAQGPNAQAAISLANASALALHDYVGSLKPFKPSKLQIAQAAQLGVNPPSRVTVRQLGVAQGGMVDSGAANSIVVLAFLGLVIVDCAIVIIIGGLLDRRRIAATTDPELEASSGHDGPLPEPHTLASSHDFDGALAGARE
jgi:hypothetical protein